MHAHLERSPHIGLRWAAIVPLGSLPLRVLVTHVAGLPLVIRCALLMHDSSERLERGVALDAGQLI